ncbi:MAG TPA: FkbM family methyltransferase [Gemmatimonadaceae bacterium]|nr:FkbM family methyltransferase [Gemmatimonadaceae bacterium]
MTNDPRGAASSDRYGRPPWLERMGNAAGRLIGDGWLRRMLRAGFRRVLGVVTGGGPRSVLPHGEVVRIAPEFRYLTWNPIEYEAFRAVLRPGDVALDVGANVGAYAILFGLWVGDAGRVLAFEPAPDAMAGLCRHIDLNRLQHRVHAVQAAVTDTVGDAGFVSEGSQGTNHLRRGAGDSTTTVITVPTTTIDAVCAEQRVRPRLIKIDVEGAELAVLRGARQTIAGMDRDAGIFVEMHPAAWHAMGQSADAVSAELAAQGLRPVPLRETSDPWALEGECVRLERI